ncbi:RNA ligase 1-like [Clavelina lepadiformis]|uniref:RNA ligase 1 n=1 Tax=Clavelina lepadiformis TaxID=159417 RepID=A0ABP0FU30_CLALP
MMKHKCIVQSKINCIFETAVESVSSQKRPQQNYRVVASNKISVEALQSEISSATATEKLDGTCCYVKEFQGKPALWARLDRKATKAANKRFQKHTRLHREWEKNDKQGCEPKYTWTYPDDMKEVPDCWIAADGVARDKSHGGITPDKNGHVPGWVPVVTDKRQYCWHNTTVDEENSLALILREAGECLELTVQQMDDFLGKTLELIGTCVNGNPYGLGSKDNPFHFLVEHGSILVRECPPIDYHGLKRWFEDGNSASRDIEGIVWHCSDGNMFKIHRHHLGLQWPPSKGSSCEASDVCRNVPSLASREVVVNAGILFDASHTHHNLTRQLQTIRDLHGKIFDSLCHMPLNCVENMKELLE